MKYLHRYTLLLKDKIFILNFFIFFVFNSDGLSVPYAIERLGTASNADDLARYQYDAGGNRLSDGYHQQLAIGLTGRPTVIETGLGG